ncbi:MAG TPA: hypothetical protein VF629_03910 [Hymenobacter sp.]|jgi:hypothetical protein|uniref:hypothetical protein n=1 Tax=Hymenobacter sp. TaxID=1898978 RepID=UPI002EDB6333
MSLLHSCLKHLAFGVLLTSAACRPDGTPTQESLADNSIADLGPPALPGDTLHLPGDQVIPLRPSSTEAFNQLPGNGMPEMVNQPDTEPLPSAQGRVRRQGLDLLLRPLRGNEVKLSSSPDAQFTLQNSGAVRYIYWGSLPAAHQWVVRAWYHESDGTVLVDQRTGQRLEAEGTPATSADGRFVLLASPGLGGGDQINALTLVKIDDAGPRLLWKREPTTWEPQEARWANPGIAILKLRHLNAQGEMPDDAPDAYVELPLPR